MRVIEEYLERVHRATECFESFVTTMRFQQLKERLCSISLPSMRKAQLVLVRCCGKGALQSKLVLRAVRCAIVKAQEGQN